jgi:hypothetical protein
VDFVSRKRRRRWLVSAIRERLLPEFTRSGFEVLPLPESRDSPPDRQLIASRPFGRLRRRSTKGDFEYVEIQVAPRARAAFRLSIGVAPSEGTEGMFGHIAAECAGGMARRNIPSLFVPTFPKLVRRAAVAMGEA